MQNRCTESEIDRLLAYFGNPESMDELRLLVEKELMNPVSSPTEEIAQILGRVDLNLRKQIIHPTKKKRSWVWMAAAAVILFIGFSGLFWLSELNGPSAEGQSMGAALVDDVPPGSSQARLHLSNGKTIDLNDVDNIDKDINGMSLQANNGQLDYRGQSGGESGTGWNILEVPKAGTFVMTLPDGTKVWLNANSKLYFPDRFAADGRMVKVEGEAFFDVHKDVTKPFTVQVDDLSIKVLGTSFNIKAQSENLISTTLVSGIIEARYKGESRKLMPGNKVLLNKANNSLRVVAADLESATAWKNGYFYFKDENLKQILQDIGLWYDLQVVVVGDLPQGGYSGSMDRNSSLKGVLAMLESVSTCSFEIDGRKLIVKAKRNS